MNTPTLFERIFIAAGHRGIALTVEDAKAIAREVTEEVKPKPFNAGETRKAWEEGMEQGQKNANAEWKKEVLGIIQMVCLSKERFTVDDFRAEVERRGVKTHDNRAMGGVIASAKAKGWIEKTGFTVPSHVGHFSPLQVWRSRLYQDPR